MYKKMIIMIMGITLIIVGSACSDNHQDEIMTIDDVIHNVEAQGLTVSTIDMPEELVSSISI